MKRTKRDEQQPELCVPRREPPSSRAAWRGLRSASREGETPISPETVHYSGISYLKSVLRPFLTFVFLTQLSETISHEGRRTLLAPLR